MDTPSQRAGPVVKICGVRTAEAAVAAADAGADIIGMIFAPSPRLIDVATARAIAQAVRPAGGSSNSDNEDGAPWDAAAGVDQGAAAAEFFAASAKRLMAAGRPLLAGVFQNQPLEHILEVARAVPLDLVQLHGTEPVAMARQIPVPVIKVFHVDDAFSVDDAARTGDMLATHHHAAILLDTKVAGTAQQGGHGVSFDWTIARRLSDRGVPFLMAGGLVPENVAEAIGVGRPWGVDVSSGVETDRVKDADKIRAFVANARLA
ncbi:anthranilate synthase / indole-3-glycerol phosphate synthase [Coemansia javaensis]|uniref:N-(5'-phosphoribosyl)anthranilate isomerase n=1 Tax=Coemansia javaensis TaxID=2761396 RepID=A0A9W8HLK2_9FUNG|nr:anthranilate synthase / indole-3-glycerol phosphate synthase [Coemansia javaensis]